MCGPEDPLFTPLLPLARVPFQAKESVHKTPFWENLEILASTALIFTQILAHKPPNLEIFSSQAPKFGNFQLTSPQIWKFSAHKPPFSEANVSSQAPHFGNPGRTPLPEKKLSAPLPRVYTARQCKLPKGFGWRHSFNLPLSLFLEGTISSNKTNLFPLFTTVCFQDLWSFSKVSGMQQQILL